MHETRTLEFKEKITNTFLKTVSAFSNYNAVYFGIGIKQLRRFAENNEDGFAMRYGNRFLICRPRFEAYLTKLMTKGIPFIEDDEDE